MRSVIIYMSFVFAAKFARNLSRRKLNFPVRGFWRVFLGSTFARQPGAVEHMTLRLISWCPPNSIRIWISHQTSYLPIKWRTTCMLITWSADWRSDFRSEFNRACCSVRTGLNHARSPPMFTRFKPSADWYFTWCHRYLKLTICRWLRGWK